MPKNLPSNHWSRHLSPSCRSATERVQGYDEGSEYPDFIAVGNGVVEFGPSRREEFEEEHASRTLTWQLQLSDVDKAIVVCSRAGLEFEMETSEPADGWRYRTLRLRTPNGIQVLLEGPRE